MRTTRWPRNGGTSAAESPDEPAPEHHRTWATCGVHGYTPSRVASLVQSGLPESNRALTAATSSTGCPNAAAVSVDVTSVQGQMGADPGEQRVFARHQRTPRRPAEPFPARQV